MSELAHLSRDDLEAWALRMRGSLKWVGETLHPEYGDCDGLADGHCSECEKAIHEWKERALRAEAGIRHCEIGPCPTLARLAMEDAGWT